MTSGRLLLQERYENILYRFQEAQNSSAIVTPKDYLSCVCPRSSTTCFIVDVPGGSVHIA